MTVDLTKLKNRFLWQTVVIVVGLVILLAELIVLAVILAGWLAPASRADLRDENPSAGEHNIVVPTVCPARLNELAPEDFSYMGDYLACTTRDYELGLDVSSYQGQIDWEQVRAAGFTFAIIRVGGRGYGEEGKLYADETAQENYAGAKAAGVKVGAYFFSQAKTEMEAREEAEFALEQIEGWVLDLPLAYDWEYLNEDTRVAGMDERDKIRVTKAFCERLVASGVQPMVYAAPWASVDYMLAVEQYPVWVALYSDQMTFPYHFDYWQYSPTGEVPGIQEKVDINIYIPPTED